MGHALNAENVGGTADIFHLTTRLSPDGVMERMDHTLRSGGSGLCGISAPGRIELHLEGERRNLWSPELVVHVRPADDGAQLTARFAAHPHVWSLYVAAVAVAAFTSLVGISFGYAQHVLGATPTGFLAVPVVFGLVVPLSIAVNFGVRLGRRQMRELRTFLESTLQTSPRVRLPE